MSMFIFPMNPKYYHAVKAFEHLKQIDWGTEISQWNFAVDDIVLIYFTTPEKKIKIITKVVRNSINPNELINDSRYITESCPKDSSIRDPFKTKNQVRLQLLAMVPDSFMGLDCRSIREVWGGRFMKDFQVGEGTDLENYLSLRIKRLLPHDRK